LVNNEFPAKRASTPACGVCLIKPIIIFLAVFSTLQLAWQASADSDGSRAFIERAVVAPAAVAVNLLTPQVHAHAAGSLLGSQGGGGINIVNGCDGMEMLFLLLAGFAAAPLPWRTRLFGMLVGVPLVYVLNQARILALFYSHRSDPNLFDALHGLIAPACMILIIIAYFSFWLSRPQRPAGAPWP
jgi:exosortase/archaeosortase family protein